MPYTSPGDERFNWLENVFLKYLNDWQGSIQNRSGNFSANAKAKMFISKQTFEGLTITVYSIINIIKFLLHEGMEFVLTEKLCQDVIEEHFGRQRSLGRRNDNPTVGYNDNRLRMQRSVVSVTGNTKGKVCKRQPSWSIVDNIMLKKRKYILYYILFF